MCCRHLYGDDRLLTVWPDDDNAIVILVAAHDRGPSDVYDQVLVRSASTCLPMNVKSLSTPNGGN